MANRVFLAFANSDDPDVGYDADDIVAAANYMLPVLWCAAFSSNDIAWRDLPRDAYDADDDGEDEPRVVAYPILYAELDAVKRRAGERRAPFFRVFPRWLETVYDQWLVLLDGIDASHLLVDTLELWGMMKPDEFEALLIECVSAFKNDEPRYWSQLLHQASIELDVSNEDVSFDVDAIPYLLRGDGWLRPMPWEE